MADVATDVGGVDIGTSIPSTVPAVTGAAANNVLNMGGVSIGGAPPRSIDYTEEETTIKNNVASTIAELSKINIMPMGSLMAAVGIGKKAAEQSQAGAEAEAQGKIAQETAEEAMQTRVAAETAENRAHANVNERIDQINALSDQGAQLLEQKRAMDRVGFFDNPIQYLVNQYYTGPKVESELQDVAAEQELRTKQLGSVMDAADKAGRENVLANTSAGAAKLAGFAQSAEGTAQQVGAQAQLRLAQLNIDADDVGIKATRAQADLAIAKSNAVFEGVRAQVSLTTQERDNQVAQAQYAAKAETAMALAGKQAGQDAIQAKLNAWGVMTGLPPMNVNEFLMQRGSPAVRAFETMNDMGLIKSDGSQPILGRSPAEAVRNINELGIPINPQLAELKKQLEASVTPLLNKNTKEGQEYAAAIASKDQGQIMKLQNDQMQRVYQPQAQNVAPEGSPFSPFSLGVAVKMPWAKELGGYDALKTAADANPRAPLDPAFVAQVYKSQVLAGKMTPAQAANDTATLYSAAHADIVGRKGYNAFALPGLSSTSGYMMKVPGMAAPVDTMNKDMWNNVYERMLLESKRQQSGTIDLTNNPFGLGGPVR